MSKVAFILAHEIARSRAIQAVRAATAGCRVWIEEPKRNLDQNAALWAALTEISLQARHPVTHAQLTPEVWKLIVMDAFGMETTSTPSLDGGHRVPIGLSTSGLSKARFSELLDFTHALGAQLGVTFHDGGNGAGGANNPAQAA